MCLLFVLCFFFFFFFQAEDGIRDLTVTGVQTCALPISEQAAPRTPRRPRARKLRPSPRAASSSPTTRSSRRRRAQRSRRPHRRPLKLRSEERRVGKEGRGRWSADH